MAERAPGSAILVVGAALLGGAPSAEELGVTRFVDSETDRMPWHTVVPEYPRVARRDRIEGEVRVCYNIDRKGRPYRVAVRNSTHRVFERPALRAVKASTYRPLRPGAKTLGVKTCRTFRFALEPAHADSGG